MTGRTQETLLHFLQAEIPIRLIATPRQDLVTCQATKTISSFLVERNSDYDFYPVVDQGKIIGLLEASLVENSPENDSRPVLSIAHKLSEDLLMADDTPLLEFIREIDVRPCCLIVAGRSITGLVSAADIQRLPVRAALFAMITHLEITMTEAIRRESPKVDNWLARLSQERALAVLKKRDEARDKNVHLDDLLYADFADKRVILQRSVSFTSSKRKFEKQLKSIEDLRNSLAHASDFASDLTQAKSLSDIVRWIDHWTGILEIWPALEG